jgi:hypothetical protein
LFDDLIDPEGGDLLLSAGSGLGGIVLEFGMTGLLDGIRAVSGT